MILAAEPRIIRSSALTPEQVEEIKALLAEDELFIGEIARRYNVTRQSIRNIKKGCTWTTEGVRKRGLKLNPAKVREIKAKLEDGYKPKALADKYRVSTQAIYRIGRGKAWRWVK